MIAKLSGAVDQILEDSIIIDVGGVGYQVFVTSKFAQQLEIGIQISARICHIFRQEMQFLCGFQNEEEMRVFKALLDVPGIGVKSGLAVLSTLSIGEVATAIATQDSAILCRVSGIGKKTAERILLELKDKSLTELKDVVKQQDNENLNDALLGLISLGYQKSNVLPLLKDISRRLGGNASANDLIIQALREIQTI